MARLFFLGRRNGWKILTPRWVWVFVFMHPIDGHGLLLFSSRIVTAVHYPSRLLFGWADQISPQHLCIRIVRCVSARWNLSRPSEQWTATATTPNPKRPNDCLFPCFFFFLFLIRAKDYQITVFVFVFVFIFYPTLRGIVLVPTLLRPCSTNKKLVLF